MTKLSEIITQLEFAWQEIKAEHADLPDAVITSSRRRNKSEKSTRAEFCPGVWTAPHQASKDQRFAEVTIYGERLLDGAVQVMQSLLHEAAHTLAHVREVKDTSNKGRFHNKKFVAIAEELGLEGPSESGGTAIGYSNCVITQATQDFYEDVITKLESVMKLYVPPAQEEEPKPKKPTRKARCPGDECDNELTWTKKQQRFLEEMAISPVTCSIHNEQMLPDEDGES